MNSFLIFSLALLFFPRQVFAGVASPSEVTIGYQQRELHLIALASIILIALAFLAIILSKHATAIKRILYWPMVIIVCAGTLASVFLTVQFNQRAWSKGPVHWQGNYEVWVCGKQVTLKPAHPAYLRMLGESFRNRESNTRIEYDGAITSPSYASLAHFIASFGGELTNSAIDFPTTMGNIHFTNGDSCRSGVPGEVQAFGYRVNSDETYSQFQISNPTSYVISPQPLVPPGDCIIIEFDEPKDKTDHLCESYKQAEENGVVNGGDSDGQ